MLSCNAAPTEIRPTSTRFRRASSRRRYDSLVDAYRNRLILYFMRYLPREDAEDLAQEVFIAAYRTLAHQDAVVTESWLYRTARHRLIDHFRRAKRRLPACSGLETMEEIPHRWSSQGKMPDFKRTEDSLWLDRLFEIAARACNTNQFTVLRSYYNQESLEAVAATLGMEYSTVRTHIQRGRVCLLVHLIRHTPDLIGGDDTVRRTISRLKRTDSDEGFSERECLALATPKRDLSGFRAACLKIARRLPDLLR